MKTLPPFLASYRAEALDIVAPNRVKDLEFSGATYQVQVEDKKSKEKVWVFLQLDEKGGIRDSFCSCESNEHLSSCVHVAAAYLYLYRDHDIPLHRRFARSLWNQLCWLCAQNLGMEPDDIQRKSKGSYARGTSAKKWHFAIKGRTTAGSQRLKQMIEDRGVETEETSLKFSNLSPDEIALWHQGRPSEQLRYELSFWSDLAKSMMWSQETGAEYSLAFTYTEAGIPYEIHAHFPDFNVTFVFPKTALPTLIPSLATVDSPLPVYGLTGEGIKSMSYDPVEKAIHIKKTAAVAHEVKQLSSKKGQHFGDWLYVPREGFYPLEKRLFSSSVLRGEEISEALNDHFSILEQALEGIDLHEDPVPVHYHLAFDKEWNLHISAYVFEIHDLQKPTTARFGDWVYIEDKGFYRLEGLHFEELHQNIPRGQVSDFIPQHRSWLNLQEGFSTHLISLEAHVSYHLDENNRLSFEQSLISDEGTERMIDFGPWVYIEGQGFYQKAKTHVGLPIHTGVSLAPHEISAFIRLNGEELALVPGFFSSRCPVAKTGIDLSLRDGVIVIVPDYELLPEYRGASLVFFDDFVYAPQEGFHQLPVDPHLPERFRSPCEIQPDAQEAFLEYELPQLLPFAFTIDKRLRRPKEVHLISQQLVKEGDAYSSHLIYRTEIGEVDVTALWKVLHKHNRFAMTQAGLLDLDEERFHWLKMLTGAKVDAPHHKLLLSSLDLLRLNAFDRLEGPTHGKEGTEETLRLLKGITEFVVPAEPDLSGMRTELRSYQHIGMRWLWFLYHQNLSGLLCDDMGLGKTHQAMALMAAVKHFKNKTAPGTRPHFLVVCPTSVIYHWQDKLRTYLPDLRVLTFYGIDRALGEFQRDYDLLLTSYGIWRNERELLKTVPFEVAIFDEIQLAKNHHSLLHSSLREANARMRVGLTGTPIENYLRELKSLFDIVLPTYMPSETDFREFFVKPIEKGRDAKRRELLARYIRPFVLRRKKEEVLSDLPEKSEEISDCPLLPQQQTLYQQVLTGSRDSLMAQLEDDSNPVPFMHVFALLSRLKRICDHPAVYWNDPANYRNYQSGKWDLFVELLSEARESQQKVVVFSQYLAQLDIFETYLKEHKIQYATIRGATTNRGEEVKRFQEDPRCEVFIASLQAAGLGIDLTAASVVIHYDRWWNAARENQATDRVHRIGQTRGVQVFKLVTRGTFEEKIDAMIKRKGQLMEDVVAADEQHLLKQFDRHELIELLRDVRVGSEDQQEVIVDTETD